MLTAHLPPGHPRAGRPQRSGLALGATLALSALSAHAASGCTTPLAHAEASDTGAEPIARRLRDEAAIAGLATCYGRALDELSIHYADRAKGKRLATALYEGCFDRSVVVEVYPLGATTPLRRTEGIGAWVDFADGFFASNRYSSTRHLMSNFAVELTGPTTARLVSYASIPHFLQSGARDEKGAAASVEYMIARYVDEAARQPDGTWRTVKKTVYLEEIWRGVGFFPGGQGGGL